ncbi:MAG: PepSY domain-containing protein [Candidatus Nitrosotalea sp.]|nr:PepSY domain-containing protein [Candidatus Nitrosotalea sp.]
MNIVTEQLLLSNVKVDFSTAATTAGTAVSNGKVIGGSLTQMQGSLVYAFKVIDDKNMAYSVIVDPSTGTVLYTSPGHAFHMGGFGIGQNGGQGHNKQQSPPISTPPATTGSSVSQESFSFFIV